MSAGEMARRLLPAERDGLMDADNGTLFHTHGKTGYRFWRERYGRLLSDGLVHPSRRTSDYQFYALTEAGRAALRALGDQT